MLYASASANKRLRPAAQLTGDKNRRVDCHNSHIDDPQSFDDIKNHAAAVSVRSRINADYRQIDPQDETSLLNALPHEESGVLLLSEHDSRQANPSRSRYSVVTSRRRVRNRLIREALPRFEADRSGYVLQARSAHLSLFRAGGCGRRNAVSGSVLADKPHRACLRPFLSLLFNESHWRTDAQTRESSV